MFPEQLTPHSSGPNEMREQAEIFRLVPNAPSDYSRMNAKALRKFYYC
jgi:hypothetical protein